MAYSKRLGSRVQGLEFVAYVNDLDNSKVILQSISMPFGTLEFKPENVSVEIPFKERPATI